MVLNPDYIDDQELDIHVKEKFVQLIQDKSRPFEWTYFQYQDDTDELMNETNTSIIHGVSEDDQEDNE